MPRSPSSSSPLAESSTSSPAPETRFCYFGSKDAVDTFCSSITTAAKENEYSESMIRLCTCTGGSASLLEGSGHQEGSKTCKSCNGKLVVDRRGTLSRNMLSTVSLELSRDSCLNWKTVIKRRQRAIRRARTSFTCENKRKPAIRTYKGSENATSEEANITGDLPISESEKLGVTILGRRFSEALGSVPIKKRRLLLVRSPSPPPHSSDSNESDSMVRSQSASYGESVSYWKNHHDRTIANEGTSLRDKSEQWGDAADFSGIVALADAACQAGIVGDIMNTEFEHSRKEGKGLEIMQSAESSSISDIKKLQLLGTSEGLLSKSEMPQVVTSTSVPHTKGLGSSELGVSNSPNDSMGSTEKIPEKSSKVESSSRDSKFPWDLNTTMGEWDSSDEEDIGNHKLDAADAVDENSCWDKKIERVGIGEDPVKYEDTKDTPESFDRRIRLVGVQKESFVLVDSKAKDEGDVLNDTLLADNARIREGSLPQSVKVSAQEELQLECPSAAKDSTGEAKLLPNQLESCYTSKNGSDTAAGNLGPDTESCSATCTMQNMEGEANMGLMPVKKEANSSYLVSREKFNCDYSNDSHVNKDQAVGLEKVDLCDEEYQYEDGELRESFPNNWGEDGEESEAEDVDYGSDNRDNDIFEVASDIPISVPLPVDAMTQENGGLSVISADRVHDGLKDSLEAVSGKCSSATNSLDVGLRKRSVERVSKNVQTCHLRENYESKKQERDLSNVSESGAENNGFCLEGDGAREFQASSRMKSSGWDQLPGHRTKHGLKDVELDHINENEATTSLDAIGVGDSFRQMGSSLRRDMPSRIERPRPSNAPQSNEKSHIRESRSDDRNSLSLKAEAEMGASRSIGRSRLPWHTHGRGGDEPPPNRPRPTHRRSPVFYGPPPSFATVGSRNAAAAAVAKVESNGFVVAPDGTIVKATSSGTVGRAPKRSSHSFVYRRESPTERDGGGMPRGLRSVREMSPDRQFAVGQDRSDRYGPEIIRGRCHKAIRDEGMEAPPSVHRQSLSRQKIFSPHKGPLHLSRSRTRSRSRSRSRTRSPHLWALRDQKTAAPNFEPDAKLERMRPSLGRSKFDNHIAEYGLPNASMWVDKRGSSPDRLREDEYKRYSSRSPSVRFFSRSDRLHPTNFPRDLEHDDYRRPMHSSRFQGCVGFGKGTRHDESGNDRREHGSRYDSGGHMKRFHDVVGDDFRVQNQRRGSSRGYERAMDSQLGDSPRRAEEERGNFRYGRSGNHYANCDDDITLRRRPS